MHRLPHWFTLGLALLVAGCAPRETAGPAAPSSGISYELALVCARDMARLIGGEVATFTPTGSMLPVLDSRTVAVIERIAVNDRFAVGDIVTFPSPDGPVCHRVTAVGGDGYVITSGDNNQHGDGWQRPTHRVVAIFYTLRP
jgi:hypothetical protein